MGLYVYRVLNQFDDAIVTRLTSKAVKSVS